MTENENNTNQQQQHFPKTSSLPKSPHTDNTFKDFQKICRAYYNELMHLSKSKTPSLSKDDIIVLDDLINELNTYANILISNDLIKEAKQLIDLGLVIVDFLLKIFGQMTSLYNINANLSEKLAYPLSLKLILLEANFNILFKYERNYSDGEKNLNEILEIQKYLALPNYNIASTKFYTGLICFFQNDLDNAEKCTLEAISLLENDKDKDKENNVESSRQKENNKIRKMSNMFEFLAELYDLKKDYQNVIAYYEKAYYLNKGRYGDKNINTEYFKTKIDIVNDEMKKYSTSFTNTNKYTKSNSNNSFSINNQRTNSNSFNHSFSNKNKTYLYTKTQLAPNMLHKGKADTFSFKIPTSNLYEPLLVSIYALGNDDNNRYTPDLFVCNLCFDKTKLLSFFGEKEANNEIFYTDENLNNILCNISLVNGYISFLDKGLKAALINSQYRK
jgi:hypothetical protein